MIELFGWSSGFLLALCGAPQAIKCWQQKHAHGISYVYVLMWFIGEIFGIIFVNQAEIEIAHKLPLYLNYLCNLLFSCVILYYRILPKKEKHGLQDKTMVHG